jgi:hypothetical protein
LRIASTGSSSTDENAPAASSLLCRDERRTRLAATPSTRRTAQSRTSDPLGLIGAAFASVCKLQFVAKEQGFPARRRAGLCRTAKAIKITREGGRACRPIVPSTLLKSQRRSGDLILANHSLIPSHLLNHDRSPWFHLETRSNFELIMFPFLYIRSNETGVDLSLYVPKGATL